MLKKFAREAAAGSLLRVDTDQVHYGKKKKKEWIHVENDE